HVRVGDDQVSPSANGLAGVLGRVSVVSERADLVSQLLRPPIHFHQLVLRKRLGGKQVQCPGLGVLYQLAQNWQVVTEGLPGCRGRDHHHVSAFMGQLTRARLMCVKGSNATRLERLEKPGGQELWNWGYL